MTCASLVTVLTFIHNQSIISNDKNDPYPFIIDFTFITYIICRTHLSTDTRGQLEIRINDVRADKYHNNLLGGVAEEDETFRRSIKREIGTTEKD